ncbi:MAG: site-specific integrase, partial [Gammaproteobacteria bacterium]|nr:site-specific integrase [Gammaproteobacteria bacterium]
FDIYGEEVTPTKARRTRQRDSVVTAMFLRFFGRDRRPETLSQRDWDRFIQARRAGRAGLSGRPVTNRTIEGDLTFLMAVLNWGARSRDEQGRLFLDRNPLKGLRKPIEKNPNRVVLDDHEYRALLRVSRQVNWRFHVALVLAHETGHRIGAICKLRWPDIDFDDRTIRWRAEHEKTGYEHTTPVTDEALAALEEARRMSDATGDAPVMPAGTDPTRCMSSSWASWFWCRAETRAGLAPRRGRGWHSLRRKFASDLMDQPLKVLCQLGGWKNAHTVLRCYQRADEGQLRKALESRRKVRA